MKRALLVMATLLLAISCSSGSGFELADDRPNLLFFHSDT